MRRAVVAAVACDEAAYGKEVADMGFLNLFGESNARKNQQLAEEFIEEGEELREEYSRLAEQAKRKAGKLQREIKAHVAYKQSLLEELGSDVSLTVETVKSIDFAARTVQPQEASALESVMKAVGALRSFGNARVPGALGVVPQMPTLLSLLVDRMDDEDEAYRSQQKARAYMLKMDEAVERAKGALHGLDTMRDVIADERRTLEELMTKLRKLNGDLKQGAAQERFTEEEAAALRAMCRIAERIAQSLRHGIVSKDGTLTKEYRAYCDDLQSVNRAIPDCPSLQEGGWRKMLRDFPVYY